MLDRKYCLVAKVNPGAGLLDSNPIPGCDPGEVTSRPSVFTDNHIFLIGLVQGLNELINANQLK